MLTSRDYTLDDLRKLVVETGRISNPKHSYMFWGHIWVCEGREPLSNRELIHKGIHMVQEDEVNVVTMLLFFVASVVFGIPVYTFILGILWQKSNPLLIFNQTSKKNSAYQDKAEEHRPYCPK